MILFQLQNVTNLSVKEFLTLKLYFVKSPPDKNYLLSLEVNLQHTSAKTKHFGNFQIQLRELNFDFVIKIRSSHTGTLDCN
jgi:hypothetical protein